MVMGDHWLPNWPSAQSPTLKSVTGTIACAMAREAEATSRAAAARRWTNRVVNELMALRCMLSLPPGGLSGWPKIIISGSEDLVARRDWRAAFWAVMSFSSARYATSREETPHGTGQ